jgi:2-keto-4-pentenoate hydratase/2-oxohepta-3-ene-1,7-dioic acid hydratase in catechol pathway
MHTIELQNALITPCKIVCIGRNYVAHIEELGNEIPDDMVVFNKPNSAIGTTLHSHLGEPLHYESELCFLVQNGEFGAVGFGLDLTKRGLQSKLKDKGLPWERAKAFDGAALFSKFVPVTENLETLSLLLNVDGELRQAGGTTLMMYKPATILIELAKFMTLEDGDVVMTGTPSGVGQILAGEHFEGKVLSGDKELLSHSWTAV